MSAKNDQISQNQIPETPLKDKFSLFEPAIFNSTTHNSYPSVSPRENLSYVGDKKSLKEIKTFLETNKKLNKLVILIATDRVAKRKAAIHSSIYN